MARVAPQHTQKRHIILPMIIHIFSYVGVECFILLVFLSQKYSAENNVGNP